MTRRSPRLAWQLLALVAAGVEFGLIFSGHEHAMAAGLFVLIIVAALAYADD